MKQFFFCAFIFIVSAPIIAMEKLHDSINVFLSQINNRISAIVRHTVYKKNGITVGTPSFINKQHALRTFSTISEITKYCDKVIKAETLRSRMRDLQYTIYIQQAVIAELQGLAQNKYILDSKLKNIVLLLQGNSKMYSSIKTAAQFALQDCYDHAEEKMKSNKTSWFAAVKEVESEVKKILEENKKHHMTLKNSFDYLLKQLQQAPLKQASAA
ncbi:MAG: hypothetical protein ACOYT8_04315 [Candidatus Dependentiae bacterium]